MTLDPTRAIVLFSGGQDSTTCLAWALERFERVDTLGFDYGQRHAVELNCRKTILSNLREMFPLWNERLGKDQIIDLNFLAEISDSSLTSEKEIEMNEEGLPSTFVPGRNMFFLTCAAAVAYRVNIKNLIAGVCETDFSGYPDCRDNTIKAMQVSLNLGMGTDFVIHTPLMRIDKAKTWSMAESIGGEAFVNLIIDETHTCYVGNHTDKYDWGYGCGDCPACEIRQRGFVDFKC